MAVVPFRTRHGLTQAELASLVIFANEVDLSIETGVTEEGWAYAALDISPWRGAAAGEAAWVVSREQSWIVAYDGEDGVLLSFITVADVLTALRRLRLANHFRAG